MAKVVISPILKEQVFKTFKQDSVKILRLMKSLEKNPQKGKTLSNVAEVVLKEIKYKKYRFYFLTNGRILRFGTEDELASLIINFIRMSEKKDQKRIIRKLTKALKAFGIA